MPVHRPDHEIATELDPVVDAAVDDGFAGGVAIMRAGEIVYSRVAGYTTVGGKTPVTSNTLFHVASISKYFTAVATLYAAEEELIASSDPIKFLLPDSRVAARGTTISELLSHQSGLGSSYVAESEVELGAALEALGTAPFEQEKIGQFRYSNDGYDLLAILLERAYKRPFEAVVKSNVFAPACLDRPLYWGTIDTNDPALVSQPLTELSADFRKRNYGMLGSAGLLITAVDLLVFQYKLASGSILSQASLDELYAPRGDTSIGKATYGAFLSEHPQLGSVISARGFEDWGDNAILNHYRDQDIIIAVVTSRGPAEGEGDAYRNRISAEIEKILIALD
jgi:CubicO group peptidase (beta-lactamase class C family)